MNLFSLEGKNAVVMGGAGGLGQAIAQGLAEAGAKVLISSRKTEALEVAASQIKGASGLTVMFQSADATNEESVQALLNYAVESMGNVDILVNSQGFNKKFDAVDFPMDQFTQMMNVNVNSVMICCKYFGKHMKENGYGKIINVSSVRGKIATKYPGNAAYCATKGAVDMLTKQLASELGPEVTVNAIGPTVTNTPMMAARFENPEYSKALSEALPLKRVALPTDCVGPAVFLASEASCFVTGNVIYPDGGLTIIG